MIDFRDQFYEHYVDFKEDWRGTPSPGFAAYFAQVQPLSNLPVGSKILEIGFGDGQFLRWCVTKGHRVTGVEIVPTLIARVHDMGIKCVLGPVGPTTLGTQMFDAIVAFDVLEHMTFEEIVDFFKHTRDHLSPDGFYLLRFPNGASPFGHTYQASDITHKSVLSLGIMKQLAQRTELEVSAVLQPRPFPSSLVGKLQRRLGYAMQDMIGWMLTRAYYGGKAHLEPNLLMTLKKTVQPVNSKPKAAATKGPENACTSVQRRG